MLFIDLGSQFSYVLERRLIELNCEVTRVSFDLKESPKMQKNFSDFQTVVLSGSPASIEEVYWTSGTQYLVKQIVENKNTPLLAIGFSMLLLHYMFKGKIEKTNPLFGSGEVHKFKDHLLLQNIPNRFRVWASCSEYVTKLGIGFYPVAIREEKCMITAHVSRPICTIQFHPECYETEFGMQLLRNFFNFVAKLELPSSRDIDIMGKTEELYQNLEREYRDKLSQQKVLVALSGGVDSTILIHFLRELMPEDDIYPIFISTSLHPLEKEEKIVRYYSDRFSKFQKIEWGNSIFEDLKGITSPEQKRRVISRKFRETFDELVYDSKSEGISYFVQGTVRSSQIESGISSPNSSKIKSHHNISMITEGDIFPFPILEPFSKLFKDQVRMLGSRFNIPPFLLAQQPFPAPGFAIRITGEVTKERVELLSSIHLFIEAEFKHRRLEHYCSQYFPILLGEKAVGIKGDKRTYGETIVIRAIETVDYMSAKVSFIPINELISLANRIVEAFPSVGRVLYDLTTKPAATIEWE